ncbi:MAG: glycosyltransferase [Holosporaceae bacterium]|jgi:glycosyltransferase involved in cell wall biosynthesis|nr:glycosyltransferase [Holosporaceae bacterium]
MPKLSLIIPIYNGSQYLRECLNSAVNQLVWDIEIICINDGSTDNSAVVLDEYSRSYSRITVINQQNAGPGVARNVGLNAASGKYIAFMDSDDWIFPNIYSCSLPLFEDDVDMVIFDVNIFGGNDNPMKKYFRQKFRGPIEINGDVILNTPTCPWNKIYRKDIIDKYDIRFPDGLLYEDNFFHWKYMMHASKAYFLSEKLYNYRIRENSIIRQMKSKSSKVNDHFLVCLKIFESMQKDNLKEQYKESFTGFFKHCLGVVCTNTDDIRRSLDVARETWGKIDMHTNDDIMCSLQNGNYTHILKWINYSFCEKIFSIKKRYGRKVITLCGMQFPLSE